MHILYNILLYIHTFRFHVCNPITVIVFTTRVNEKREWAEKEIAKWESEKNYDVDIEENIKSIWLGLHCTDSFTNQWVVQFIKWQRFHHFFFTSSWAFRFLHKFFSINNFLPEFAFLCLVSTSEYRTCYCWRNLIPFIKTQQIGLRVCVCMCVTMIEAIDSSENWAWIHLIWIFMFVWSFDPQPNHRWIMITGFKFIVITICIGTSM